jgi:hypothetical protein
MIGEGDCGAIGGMKIGKGNRSTRRKPTPAPLCPPQITLDQTRDPTRAAAVGSQRLKTKRQNIKRSWAGENFAKSDLVAPCLGNTRWRYSKRLKAVHVSSCITGFSRLKIESGCEFQQHKHKHNRSLKVAVWGPVFMAHALHTT